MRETSGVNEKYVRQCLEANRHNAATAHYYLLLKKKILDGETLDLIATNTQINAGQQVRITKSITAPRTTKHQQFHQLRKIAEGLGDMNLVRIRNASRDASNEKEAVDR